MTGGDAGRAYARKRFGVIDGDKKTPTHGSPPPGAKSERQWTLEHLLANHKLRGVAYADQRFHRNPHARRALTELTAAVRAAENDPDNQPDDGA